MTTNTTNAKTWKTIQVTDLKVGMTVHHFASKTKVVSIVEYWSDIFNTTMLLIKTAKGSSPIHRRTTDTIEIYA